MKVIILLSSLFCIFNVFTMNNVVDPIEKLRTEARAKALDYLIKGDLDDLDPLVGDTACEIRAVKIADIYLKARHSGIESLSTEEKEFLTLSYLLAKSKDIKPNKKTWTEKSDYKKWGIEIGTHKGRKLLIELQQRLASLSVEFIQELATHYNNPGLIKALSYVLLDHVAFKRPTCACYPTMTILLDYMVDMRIPLLIKVASSNEESTNESKFYYKVDGKKYVPASTDELNENDPIIVIESFSNLIDTNPERFNEIFLTLDIKEIILSFFASHKQFTGKQIYEEVPYDADLSMGILKQEHIRHKKFSIEHGCCLENKSLFLGDHIYVSTVKKTLKI